ncbi:MAG: DbpA RNA binding domain-containing protein [Treponema sp.]|jgi:hypothetical protein|nr:DbpA RNA binding domain-containing protein [Treponema sp.]
MSFEFDKERLQEKIQDILVKIKTEADPELLNTYRSILRKNAPFFTRSYVAAYLLMQLDGGYRGRKPFEPRGKKPSFSRTPDSENPKRDPDSYPLAEADSVRLFISIGRNRRVFPREILGLINSETATPKEDIGAIRILDNYSFIQVRNTVADTIIEALNGKSFRGRVLTVNYAKNRKEDDEETQPDVTNE